MEMSLMMMLTVITFILTFSSLLETTHSRIYRQPRTNVLLTSGSVHEAVGSNNWYGRNPPKSPPPPEANTPSRPKIDGNQYVAATGGDRTPAASHSLSWSFASYYINKLESFIFLPTIIGNNWYGRDSPKSPPSPTANTPGRQIDGDQYVAATGGYRRPALAVPPPPPYPPAVIGLTFSLRVPQLDESS